MIIFSEKSREAMIPIIEKEDEKIDKLQEEYNELQIKLASLEEKIDKLLERRSAVVEAYGLSRDYINKQYILDPDYAKEASD